ncbi:A/G-specific adenine glycosylase, partial [Campylobacter jejuni]|nr:A/G-specific adenine glycosylase [Campylobacter jejuni]
NIKVYHQILNNENKNYEFKTLKELESTALSALSLKALKLIKL